MKEILQPSLRWCKMKTFWNLFIIVIALGWTAPAERLTGGSLQETLNESVKEKSRKSLLLSSPSSSPLDVIVPSSTLAARVPNEHWAGTPRNPFTTRPTSNLWSTPGRAAVEDERNKDSSADGLAPPNGGEKASSTTGIPLGVDTSSSPLSLELTSSLSGSGVEKELTTGLSRVLNNFSTATSVIRSRRSSRRFYERMRGGAGRESPEGDGEDQEEDEEHNDEDETGEEDEEEDGGEGSLEKSRATSESIDLHYSTSLKTPSHIRIIPGSSNSLKGGGGGGGGKKLVGKSGTSSSPVISSIRHHRSRKSFTRTTHSPHNLVKTTPTQIPGKQETMGGGIMVVHHHYQGDNSDGNEEEGGEEMVDGQAVVAGDEAYLSRGVSRSRGRGLERMTGGLGGVKASSSRVSGSTTSVTSSFDILSSPPESGKDKVGGGVRGNGLRLLNPPPSHPPSDYYIQEQKSWQESSIIPVTSPSYPPPTSEPNNKVATKSRLIYRSDMKKTHNFDFTLHQSKSSSSDNNTNRSMFMKRPKSIPPQAFTTLPLVRKNQVDSSVDKTFFDRTSTKSHFKKLTTPSPFYQDHGYQAKKPVKGFGGDVFTGKVLETGKVEDEEEMWQNDDSETSFASLRKQLSPVSSSQENDEKDFKNNVKSSLEEEIVEEGLGESEADDDVVGEEEETGLLHLSATSGKSLRRLKLWNQNMTRRVLDGDWRNRTLSDSPSFPQPGLAYDFNSAKTLQELDSIGVVRNKSFLSTSPSPRKSWADIITPAPARLNVTEKRRKIKEKGGKVREGKKRRKGGGSVERGVGEKTNGKLREDQNATDAYDAAVPIHQIRPGNTRRKSQNIQKSSDTTRSARRKSGGEKSGRGKAETATRTGDSQGLSKSEEGKAGKAGEVGSISLVKELVGRNQLEEDEELEDGEVEEEEEEGAQKSHNLARTGSGSGASALDAQVPYKSSPVPASNTITISGDREPYEGARGESPNSVSSMRKIKQLLRPTYNESNPFNTERKSSRIDGFPRYESPSSSVGNYTGLTEGETSGGDVVSLAKNNSPARVAHHSYGYQSSHPASSTKQYKYSWARRNLSLGLSNDRRPEEEDGLRRGGAGNRPTGKLSPIPNHRQPDDDKEDDDDGDGGDREKNDNTPNSPARSSSSSSTEFKRVPTHEDDSGIEDDEIPPADFLFPSSQGLLRGDSTNGTTSGRNAVYEYSLLGSDEERSNGTGPESPRDHQGTFSASGGAFVDMVSTSGEDAVSVSGNQTSYGEGNSLSEESEFNNSSGPAGGPNSRKSDKERQIDIVTKFLLIVETQHLLGGNCTAGTALNLGEGVVDRYAQERFRLEAEVAVNRANMLTRLWKYVEPEVMESEYLLHSSLFSMIEFDDDIFAAGNCYDKLEYKNYTLFCPYAFRLPEGITLVKDLAVEYKYLSNDSEWFFIARKNAERVIKNSKQFKYGFNSYTYNESTHTERQEEVILSVTYEDGKWSKPYFDCGGGNIWMMTYTVPFFGYRDGQYFFKGTSGIDIDLRRVDIDQCPLPGNSTELNIFAASDKCKNNTTKCVPIKGLGFRRGSYRCVCQTGFYFPNVSSTIKYFNGTVLEEEYEKKLMNDISLYDQEGAFECLRCPVGCDTCVDDKPCVVTLNWLMRSAILILQCGIIGMLPLVGLFTWKYSDIKVVRAASPVLLRFIVLGAFFIYCTILVMYPSPSLLTCTLRIWLREIGFSLAYGALMLKTWRISVIFRVRSAKAIKITDLDLMKRLGVIIAIFTALLMIRTLVDPPVAIVSYTADNLKAWLCKSGWWDHSFTIMELIFLVWGICLCIVVRKAPSEFNESKFISLAIYNEFLLSVFLNISMFFLQSPANPDLLYIIFFCHVQLTMTLLLCLIFGSKAYMVFRGQGKGSSSEETRVPTFISKNRSGQKAKQPGNSTILHSSTTSTSNTHDPNFNFRLSEDVQEEFRRLYLQLEELKDRNLRVGNRHLVAKIAAMQEAAENMVNVNPSPHSSLTVKQNSELHRQDRVNVIDISTGPSPSVLSNIKEEESSSQTSSYKPSSHYRKASFFSRVRSAERFLPFRRKSLQETCKSKAIFCSTGEFSIGGTPPGVVSAGSLSRKDSVKLNKSDGSCGVILADSGVYIGEVMSPPQPSTPRKSQDQRLIESANVVEETKAGEESILRPDFVTSSAQVHTDDKESLEEYGDNLKSPSCPRPADPQHRPTTTHHNHPPTTHLPEEESRKRKKKKKHGESHQSPGDNVKESCLPPSSAYPKETSFCGEEPSETIPMTLISREKRDKSAGLKSGRSEGPGGGSEEKAISKASGTNPSKIKIHLHDNSTSSQILLDLDDKSRFTEEITV